MVRQPFRIDIDQERPGFEHFIGSWVFPGETRIIVDVGPARSADRLLVELARARVERVDWVLLTHIHIDHAGALAAVLERFPTAKAVCHAKGVSHMVDPARLWAGSRKVLGEMADVYGPPRPVPAERIIPHDQTRMDGLTILETPGHALHHLSYSWHGHLLAGESAGNFFKLQNATYMRPGTPPRFFLEQAVGSVEKMLNLPDQPIYYGHADMAPGSHGMLERYKRQLYRWRDLIAAEVAADSTGDLAERCVEAILENDPEVAAFAHLDSPKQARERYFFKNSIAGFLGYLENAA